MIRGLLVPAAFAAAAAMGACAGTELAPTPIGVGALGATAIERLLTMSDVEDAGGATGGLDRTVEDTG